MGRYKVNINGNWTDVCDCKYKVYNGNTFRQIIEGDKFWNGSSWETIICNLNMPGGVLATQSTTSDEITITWVDNANNELNYRVEVSKNGGSYQLLGNYNTDVTFAIDLSAKYQGETYRYRVRAERGIDSIISDWAYSNIETIVSNLVAPVNISATQVGEDIGISWDDNTIGSGLREGYKIEFLDNTTWVLVGTVGATALSFIHTYFFQDGVSYKYRVFAYHSYGESAKVESLPVRYSGNNPN